MEYPDLPGNERSYDPNSDEDPISKEKSKRKTKVVVSSGVITHRPDEAENNLPQKTNQPTASALPIESRAKAAAVSKYSGSGDAQVSPHLVEKQSARPILGSTYVNPREAARNKNPGRRLHEFEAAARNGHPTKLPWRYRLIPTRERTRRAYWDIGTTFSLVINAVLVAIVVIMAGEIRDLKTNLVGTVNGTVNGLLGGLYSNFVKMDQASINTTINVNAQIPLDFTLPVSQNTQVTLTNNVSIPHAHVVINTGGLNINADANVTLPAGTVLPIALNLLIPVQQVLPINLLVPVNIPLNQTELHEPFTGLQTTLRPLYCMLNKDAQYPEGFYICAEHDTPTPGTP